MSEDPASPLVSATNFAVEPATSGQNAAGVWPSGGNSGSLPREAPLSGRAGTWH